MSISRILAPACVALATLLLSGCGDVIDPSKNVTDEHSGTLQVNGPADTYRFTASKNGEFEVKVTRLSSPDSFIGLMFGPELNGQCTEQQRNIFGQLNRVALGGLINSGRNCVLVFDSIGLTQPLSYTITISHP